MRYRNHVTYRVLLLLLAAAMLLSGCAFGNKRVTKETDELTLGVDVARYQGTIDWQLLADSGMDFAMVRLGYRSMSTGEIVEDCNARYNLQEGAKYGIPLGAYFFSTAISAEEAEEEAKWAAELIAKYPITYPVAYDCEGFREPDSRQFSLSKEERTEIAMAFMETIEKLGYEAMFYGSRNDLQDDAQWETSRIAEEYKIWVAQYPLVPYPGTAQSTYTGEHQMWQYSMEGAVAGIGQDVDLNVAYFGYDGIEPAKDPEAPEEAFPDVEALLDFEPVEELVTAKDATNLRSIPSQGEESVVLYTLQNGQIATRIAVCASGWSKLVYEGTTYYAVSNYLTTNLSYDPSDPPDRADEEGIQTQFTAVNEQVTAKKVVNLRLLPSVENEDAKVIAQLENGDIAQRIGVSDNGWSKLIYNGTICYAVSSYLTTVSAASSEEQEGIQTEFEEINDMVTAKIEVNLRTLPSVTDPDSRVVVTIKHGDVVVRTGINRDLGWSRVIYNGQILYCVSSYLEKA